MSYHGNNSDRFYKAAGECVVSSISSCTQRADIQIIIILIDLWVIGYRLTLHLTGVVLVMDRQVHMHAL